MVALALKPGWLGVDLFFVLSGFLITRVLVRDKGKPRYLRTFYIGRAFRILPCYSLVVTTMYFLYPHAHSYLFLSTVFLSNMAPLFAIQPVNGVLWSLAIEEHFYLGWPFAVRALRRRTLLAVLISVCCGMPLIRTLGGIHGADVYYYTWFRLDGLAFGAILAILAEQDALNGTLKLPRLALTLTAAAAAMSIVGGPLGILTRTTIQGAALQQTCISMAFAGVLGLVIGVEDSPVHRLLRVPLLRSLGSLSYGTYLIHMVVMNAYDRLLVKLPEVLGWAVLQGLRGMALRAAICLAVTLFLASLMNLYIERPSLALRRRFTQRLVQHQNLESNAKDAQREEVRGKLALQSNSGKSEAAI